MTMREKIEKAVASLRRDLADLQIEAKKVADDIVAQAHEDVYSRSAGLATSAGARNLTVIGTQIADCHKQIAMLEFFLRDGDM